MTRRAGRGDGRGEGPVTIAIGDVHGRADLLEKLLAMAEREFEGREQRYVLLGDYVDRGPDSAAVIDRLLRLRAARPDTVCLKGNHEQALLDFLAAPEEGASWLEWGGQETLESYGVAAAQPWEPERLRDAFAEALPDPHFAFLMSLDLTHRLGDILFVHAGLNPARGLEEQQERDLLWIRESWRKGGRGRFPGLLVVHGHTPVQKPDDLSWRINVDTGAVWTGRLTAVCLEEGRRSYLST